MLKRSLFSVAFSNEWGRQMRFITGPRQTGKTTLAKQKLDQAGNSNLYYLWDLRSVRERYKTHELFFTADAPPMAGRKQWVYMDEIHKLPKWKNTLKAIFDSTGDNYQFIVTGSAKLHIFKKAGDSLSGRYFTFQLHLLGVWELTAASSAAQISPPSSAREWAQAQMDKKEAPRDVINSLLAFSGFPEPFLAQSQAFSATWSRDYMDTVIKEDVGALTRIVEKERLYDLYNLLPEMTGAPLSNSSLASHLEISNPTVKNHLRRLEDFYLVFKVHPYAKNIKRALLKAPKCYLYNWCRVQNEGHRFENFIAVQLIALTSLWSSQSGDEYAVFYVRNKQKEETDFLILKNKKPWLLIEAKLSDGSIDSHHYAFQAQLGNIPLLQVCREPGIASLQTKNSFRLSAARLFS